MDSTAGDLNSATREVGANIEKQLSRGSHDESSSAGDLVGEKHDEQGPHSSGSSSDGIAQLKEVDSHIVKVPEVKEGEEAYAHLPTHEKEVVKRQLDMPEVKVTFKTLYRYATRVDLIIVAISLICAIAGGAVMPLMTVSHLVFEFVRYTAHLRGSRSFLVNSLASFRATFKTRYRIPNSLLNWTTSRSILSTLRLESSLRSTSVPWDSSTLESISQGRSVSSTWQPFCVKTLHSSTSLELERLRPVSRPIRTLYRMGCRKRSPLR